MLCIDPKTQETYEVGQDLSSLGGNKFNGGAVLGPGGVIYGVHRFGHGKILRVDPPLLRERVSLIDAPKEGFDGWWYGGALAPDGCIYYVPGGAKQVLRFDPATEERKLIGPEITGFDDRHKYMGCVRADDGVLYGIPCRAHHVLKIDVRAKEVVTFMDTDLSEYGDEKWAGGALGPDGCIYGTPCRSDKVLKIDAREQKVSTFNTDLGNTPWKYHGSALGSDGCIYAAPHDAPKVQQFLNKSLSTSA